VSGDLDRELRAQLDELAQEGLQRDTVLDGVVPGADFGSNDYLGLARDPEVIEAMCAAAREHGAGGRSARLLKGGSPLHERAERALAQWLGCEAALLFPSGYQANVGLVGALVGRGDVVVSDRDNHASLIDAARLSRARVLVHEHLDLDDLERCLRNAAGARRRLVLTEAVFSMAGDAAPLVEIEELCRRHDAWLVVDEAHSVGLLGPEGAGAWAAADVAPPHRVCARVVTCGKALGVAGAFVAGSAALRSLLIHRARSFLFTTAPPPAIAGALCKAIERCRGAELARRRVLQSARLLAERLGLPRPAAAIVPVPVGDAGRAAELAATLRERGVYAPAVRPPTVAPEQSGLRVVCQASQRDEDVERLVELLADRTQAASTDRTPGGARTTFVVGTDTGIGKTVVSAVLLRAALRRGRARYWKPVQTGDDDDTITVRELAACAPDAALPNFAHYPLPASPHEAAAHAGQRLDVSALRDRLATWQRELAAEELLVEFAGGLLVPYTDAPLVTQADLLASTKGRIVLVARAGLGTLNHTSLTVEALRARGLSVRALLLVGEPHDSNRETLRATLDVPNVYELPMLSPLDTASIDAWLQEHDDLRELFDGE